MVAMGFRCYWWLIKGGISLISYFDFFFFFLFELHLVLFLPIGGLTKKLLNKFL